MGSGCERVYDGAVTDRALTLIFASDAPGTATVILLGGAAAGVWRGAHTYDAAQVATERTALARVLRRALRRGGDLDALTEHGRLLFDLILPGPAKDALRELGAGSLTCVVAGAERPPWPLLHDGADFLGCRWAIGEITASGDIASATQPDIVGPVAAPTRLLVVADPAEDLPAARFEGEALAREFGRGGSDLQYDVRLGAMRRGDLLRVFKSFGLVHFAGHADPDDDRSGGWRMCDGRLDAAAIGALRGGPAPRLVFANACRSADVLAATLLDVGVRHVVATTVDVPDLGSADFATVFYRALRSGAAIGEALRRARADTAIAKSALWCAYRLFGDPRTVYFPTIEAESRLEGVRRGVVLAVRGGPRTGAPEALADAHTAWRRRVASIAERHDGRLLPGHSAVDRIVFGVPKSFENDAVRAARAAIALRDAPDADAVLVLDTGAMTVVGDNAITEEVIGEAIWRAEAATWRQCPGVHALPAAARVLDEHARFGPATDDGTRRLIAIDVRSDGGGEPMVGRTAELARVEAIANGVVQPAIPASVAILGPAGIGKSRLIDAICDRLRHQFTIFRGAGTAYDDTRPYAAAAAIVRALIGAADADPPPLVRQQLERYLDDLDDARGLFGCGAAGGGPPGLDTLDPAAVATIDDLLRQDVRRPRLSTRADALAAVLGLDVVTAPGSTDADLVPLAFRELIEAAARRQPLALVFEDLHWMPAAGLAVVGELVCGLSRVPVLVVATARPEVAERMPSLGAGRGQHRLDLGPLSDDAAERVLHGVLPDGAPSALIDRLRTRAEGNPLFLRELAKAHREAPADDAPPSTIEAVVQARLDRQDAAARDALGAASVLGRAFWTAGVGRLLGVTENTTPILAALERRGFIARDSTSELPGHSQWRFAHALFREVVYRGLGRRARAAWHARAALWLDEEVGADRHDLWAQVAAHRHAGGDPIRATADWLRAAERARARFAPADARRAYERALACDDTVGGALPDGIRGGAEHALADLARADGDLDEAARRLDAAIGRTPTDAIGVWAHRQWRRTKLDAARGDLAAARDGLERVLTRVGDGEEGRVSALQARVELAWLDYRERNPDGCAERLRRVLDEVRPDEKTIIGRAHTNLGHVASSRGDYVAAGRRHRDALEAFRAAGDEMLVATSYNNLGIVAMMQGDEPAAERHYLHVVRIRVRRGDRSGLAQAYNNLGSLYGEMGDYARAARFLEESIRIREPAGHTGLALGYTNLGEVYLRQGRLDLAVEYLGRAIALCESGRAPGYLQPEVWRAMAELRLARDEIDAAAEAARRAIRTAEDAGDRRRLGVAWRVLGETLTRSGQDLEAEAALANAHDVLGTLDAPKELARTCLARARLAAPRDPQAAAVWTAQARDLDEGVVAAGVA